MSRRSSFTCSAATFALVVLCAIVLIGQGIALADPLVVHEWGTFTSLQDERGSAIGGINADDEPVPNFVHRLNYNLVLGPKPNVWFLAAKSIPQSHPDVTMRLETPVVYFHPGRGAKTPFPVNIEVAFRGGWLSEFYPKAEFEAPGIKGSSFGPLSAATVGRLAWNNLQVGTDAAGPETDSKVWLAPRAVDAANVTTADGESERYLFYRGIGNVESPLRVSRDHSSRTPSLVVTAEFPIVPQTSESELVVPALWLVDIREDKTVAFRALEGFRVPNDGLPRQMSSTRAGFDDTDYSADNIDKLEATVHTALVDDGLFADEAQGLLNTWRASYFETPGLRLFYLLPQEWTNQVLPMKLSVDAKLVRTMVGRVEIVTPEQRTLLREIAAGPASKSDWMYQEDKKRAEPADYRAFQSLGRFRNALVLDELKRRPTEPMQTFVNNYSLAGYVPRVTAVATETEATTTAEATTATAATTTTATAATAGTP